MRLIPFTKNHFALLASWFTSEEEVVCWGGPLFHYPLDDQQLQSLVDACHTEPPQRKCWMAEDGGQLVGHIELGFDWRNGNAILQRVGIDPKLRGKGLAEPMVRLAVAEAFADLRIFRLELNVYSFNQIAIKTYTKAGFKIEGVRRSSTQVGNDRWDCTIMSLLREEYTPR
ncbi:MAG: GNAT family N-acetyltransferase [Chloroflexi bacterium]|nr:GNAT family N-acetyltransferase [Chloroflexota bacterium]